MTTTHTQDDLLARVGQLKVFPKAASRVQTLLQDPNCTLNDIEQAVRLDPVLTGKIMKIANSAFYGMGQRIETVRAAILFLGFRQTRDISVAMALGALGDRTAPHRDRLWRHAVHTAAAAMGLARYQRRIDGGTAFISGMLHDLGTQLFLELEEAALLPLLNELPDWDPRILVHERRLFGLDHAALGAQVANEWQIGIKVGDAIGMHHSVRAKNRGQPNPVLQLAALIALADRMAEDFADGKPSEVIRDRAREDPLNQILQIPEPAFDVIISVFVEEAVELEALLR